MVAVRSSSMRNRWAVQMVAHGLGGRHGGDRLLRAHAVCGSHGREVGRVAVQDRGAEQCLVRGDGTGAAACRLEASDMDGECAPSCVEHEHQSRRSRRELRRRQVHACRKSACPWMPEAKSVSLAQQGGKIGTSAHTAIFFRSPDLIQPLARRGRHAALWLPLHVADRVPPREAGPRSRLPSTNPPHTHTTPHYSPHLTPHCSRLYVATFLVQCTRVPIRVNVGFNKLTSGQFY